MREALRKAGDALRKADDEYSGRIREMYKGAHPLVQTVGVTVGGGIPSTRRLEVTSENPGVIDNALSYALPAVNAVPKYAAPVGGVALAGKALIDLTAQFGGAADQPEQQQLTLK